MRIWMRRITRGLSPVTFVLIGLCFLLPFVTVSCDAPGGYGRAAPGGTTTYTGFDLATGGSPSVTPADKVRPGEDNLEPQVLALAVLALALAGLVIAVAIRDAWVRRGSVALLGLIALLAHLANQHTVTTLIAARLGPLPPGKTTSDYVHTAEGFAFALVLLTAVVLANGIGLILLRRGTPSPGNPPENRG